MRKTSLFTALLWLFCTGGAYAADIKLLPADVPLTGPHARQQLLVLSELGGQFVADLTDKAKFTSSNPAVVTVDETGLVRAAGDGEAVITATADGKQAIGKVHVAGLKAPFTWSYRNHVIPMLTKVGCNSGACHGALAGKSGFKLSLRGYDPAADHFAMTRQARGRRVDKLEPARSLVLLKPTRTIPHGGGRKLEVGSSDYRVLLDWIAAGAPGPRDDDPRIQRLEVFPAAAVLKPKDNVQVNVRAWYSDGHAEDVTPWAKFSSSEDQVATVDQDGSVTVAAAGEAAISVWYSDLVASCRIAVPLPNTVDAAVYTGSPRRNYIDDLVLKKLEALHIPPSQPCTDAEFIRRAYLDAAGTLPTPEEVQKFVGSSDPDKRTRLIDAVLRRPEFVDYWAYKWSDLLLVSSRNLPQSAVWAFYQFIRQGVADDKPWDRFAQEVLTANGSNLENGAANYFVLHKDVTDLTESTAVTFLGMSLTCARCHNHPLEKWTQDQYWSMANLFSRVGLKNGERPGEVTVQSQPTGDVAHPRRGVPMPPTPLDAKSLPFDSPVDRRQYFADWLTSPGNPYFARALVNRVWRNFMGRGLVEAEDDLRQTNPPSNEELFAALAKEFVEDKYDVKYLVRTIMNSAAYQRSSVPAAGNEKDDRFYSHYLVRRLPAEVVLDAYAQVTGVPTPFTQVQVGPTGGTSATTQYPAGTRAQQLPDTLLVSQFLDAFGRPLREKTCSCEREQDASIGQALHLNNGPTLNDKLRDKNSRVAKWVEEKVGDDAAVRRLFLLAVGREPSADERKKFTGLLAQAEQDTQTSRRETMEDLFWAVLTGREFLFNH
jgi:hypothetical protein